MSANTGGSTGPLSPHSMALVVERIQHLRERLSHLEKQTPKTAGLFRLGYTILMLERSLEERNLSLLRLADAPAINQFLDQLDYEIDLVTETLSISVTGEPTEAEIAADYGILREDPYYGSEQRADSDPMAALLAELKAVQKWQRSESRRLSASLGAQHAAIERLTERMARIEDRLSGGMVLENRIRRTPPSSPPTPLKDHQLDPRPMLAAARAAAARTLVASWPTAADPSSKSDRPFQPEGLKPQPEAAFVKAKRGLKFLFSAA
jgi:hypothetical protein